MICWAGYFQVFVLENRASTNYLPITIASSIISYNLKKLGGVINETVY
ncbi:MAG: hypothetical protein K0R66_792 [Gammaproteobacteria bacterium]|jgi:hypothetical protein|nr:hypothetical protein [Gammaproteobacteria bacterium]